MTRRPEVAGGRRTVTAALINDGRTLAVRVPLALAKRGGRKLILAPDGTMPAHGARQPRVDTAIVRALARAHRWQRMIETGRFATIGDLARTERVNPSYLARVLRLTLLAPDIVEAILDGRQPAGITLGRLMQVLPVAWSVQQMAVRHQSKRISASGSPAARALRKASA